MKKLHVSGYANLSQQMANDFISFASSGNIPNKLSYKISDDQEDLLIESFSRKAGLSCINQPLTKLAFDQRKFDPTKDIHPRTALQNYIRNDEYLDRTATKEVEILLKLKKPIEEIYKEYHSLPEWIDSYSRSLQNGLDRIMNISFGELELFKPQIEYLKQLLYLRYRLSLEDILSKSEEELKKIILEKDEKMVKSHTLDKLKSSAAKEEIKKEAPIIKDSNGLTQESIVNAIFGNNQIRRSGEKTVERTITITIRDQVLD